MVYALIMTHLNFVTDCCAKAAKQLRLLVPLFYRLSVLFFCGLLTPQMLFAGQAHEFNASSSQSVVTEFSRQVSPRLLPPQNVQISYAEGLQNALEGAGFKVATPQYVVLVDRNPHVQAVFLYFGSTQAGWIFIGASPTSTGLPGEFDHFLTPLGVFEHSLSNLDFRAEGTKNEFGFRGYGEKGMRVYDFGWVQSEQGWGKRGMSEMRLQMHTTDPQFAEPLLGIRRSKGCIRIPATLNDFIDRYGLLDADYALAQEQGRRFWVIRPDRTPVHDPGRYLIVINSVGSTRPLWSPLPKAGKLNK